MSDPRPPVLSEHPQIEALEERFGLLGYARFVKLLEQCDGAGTAAMSAIDWMGVLRAGRDDVDTFLAFLAQRRVIELSQSKDPSAPVLVQVVDFEQYHVDPSYAARAVVVFTTAAQWSAWLSIELSVPAFLINDGSTQRLLRHWCATNVTLAEAVEAVDLATKATPPDITPAALHDYIKAIRVRRIEEARR